MPQSPRVEINEKDIPGLKYFAKLKDLLEELKDVGCERDRPQNRTLHMDEYCMLVLLYLFNPILTSLRGLQQARERALGTQHFVITGTQDAMLAKCCVPMGLPSVSNDLRQITKHVEPAPDIEIAARCRSDFVEVL